VAASSSSVRASDFISGFGDVVVLGCVGRMGCLAALHMLWQGDKEVGS
jgi:uncharacterized membrane protein YqgA involved in biofilm formation